MTTLRTQRLQNIYLVKGITVILLVLVGSKGSYLGKFEKVLLERFVKDGPPSKNLVICPWTLHSSLIPLFLGAEDKTKVELEGFLNSEFSSYNSANRLKHVEPNFTATTFTGLFTSKSLVPSYYNTKSKDLTISENFNFKNYETINQMISTNTRGLIKDFIGPDTLDPSTELLIVSTLYFKGNWKKAFNPKLTTQQYFYSGTTKKSVQMMVQQGLFSIANVPELNAKILDLPYENGTLTFRVILPNRIDGLEPLLQNLSNINLLHLSFRIADVEVRIPRFHVSSSIELREEMLAKVGLKTLFDSKLANFSLLSNTSGLKLNKIISQTILEVNEEGSEGASATGVQVVPLSILSTYEFIADHPFIFQILEKESSTVLFSGIFSGPEDSSGDLDNNYVELEEGKTSSGHDLTTDSRHQNLDSPSESQTSDEETSPQGWWIHKGKPAYLNVILVPPQKKLASSISSSKDGAVAEDLPRFQQPEPTSVTGIRFPYPLLDPLTKEIMEMHLRNISGNVIRK